MKNRHLTLNSTKNTHPNLKNADFKPFTMKSKNIKKVAEFVATNCYAFSGLFVRVWVFL